MADESSPRYWNDLYLAGDTGWDKGRPSPPLMRVAREVALPRGSKLVVIGAGRGHDAVALAALGYDVTAVDFAEEAVRAMRASGAAITALQSDLFDLPRRMPAAFDALVEHTCFCAIDPARRGEYVEVVRAVLKPAGTMFGLFYQTGRDGGPPWATDEAEIRRLFAPHFTIERLAVAPDSFPERTGRELEFVFRRL